MVKSQYFERVKLITKTPLHDGTAGTSAGVELPG